MSTENARINPKLRELDFERAAEAILQMAVDLDDEASRAEGRQIRQRLSNAVEGAA